MRRPTLSFWLTALTSLAVATATAVTGFGGFTLLRRLAWDQARARTALAAEETLHSIERDGDRLHTAAELLAERPTLGRLIEAGDTVSAAEFLERFRGTSRLDGCAVVRDGRLWATSGDVPPAILEALPPAVSGWQVIAPPELALAAAHEVPGSPGRRVVARRRLDRAYAETAASKVGLDVVLFADADPDPHRARALAGESPVTWRDDDGDVRAAVVLRDAAGRAWVGIETRLASAAVDRSLHDLVRTLLLVSAAVGALAALAAARLARRVVRPLNALTDSAERIGLGDFASPVARARGPEAGTLAAAMEDMRVRILALTTELRQRQAQSEAILGGIAEGVFAVDRERRLRYLNPQAAALLGVDEPAVLGHFCGDVLRPRTQAGVRPCDSACPILHARFRGSASANEALQLPGGRRTVVITSAHPPGDEAAEGLRQFQVLRDETELEAGRRLRDAVLANISHEFRSPLSAQLASLELLRDQLPDLSHDEIADLVTSLERGTLRLTRLIDNLLESTRIEAGQDSLRRHEIALDEVVEEAVGLMAPLLAQRHQHLDVALPYPLPAIEGDGPRLTQVFVNLLSNANKYAPESSIVAIGGELDAGEIRLWVDDEGAGFPTGIAASVFERFTRSSGDEPEQQGMGLGLWIVKSIVERHGGRVTAESHRPGTRVTVALPRRGPAGSRS